MIVEDRAAGVGHLLSDRRLASPSVPSKVLGGYCQGCHPRPGDPVWHSIGLLPDTDHKPIPNEFSSRLMAIPSVPS